MSSVGIERCASVCAAAAVSSIARVPVAVAQPAGERIGSSDLPGHTKISRAEFWSLLLGCGLFVLLANQPFLESLFVWRAVADLTFKVEPGPSPAMRFPQSGPYDQRFGYVELPSLIRRLTARNFEVVSQARQSPALLNFVDAGGYTVYHEKSQAGLVLKDDSGQPLEAAPYLSAAYQHFDRIPALLVDTLRFIEDRDLLDPKHPYRNPAIEWRRFAWAAAGRLGGVLDPGLKRGGASTLATQIEKYRHSPSGRTENMAEKMRQMATATARAYLDGPDTLSAQQQIITAYLDSTPMSSRPGYGEVIGFGDGMLAWFGVDFAEVNRLLSLRGASGAEAGRRAQVYKEALSLLIAQRRPSYYLNAGRRDLEHLADSHLRVLAAAGVIDPALRDAALQRRLVFTSRPPAPTAGSFVERKAVDAVRGELMTALGLPEVYRLDRMDLSADVSFDAAAQSRVAAVLQRLKDPREVAALGLIGEQLLGDADPGKVVWSVVLYERGKDRNLVRIHADNLNQPFDINSGAKLILGSTAKLRTLATYLGIVDSLYRELSTSPDPALQQMAATSDDPLRRWAAGYLAGIAPEHRALQPMLDAAMQRSYSASPSEEFFTGGGIHVFHNFEHSEDRLRPTVEQAFEYSINLAFVRLLRDVIRHYEAEPGARDESLSSGDGTNTRQQDVRIRGLIEQKAFDRLLQDWKRQGYPFGRLVPSLASAIGSSGDRPDALATLMGIILNDGVKQSTTDIQSVRFAAGTPYETEMSYRPEAQERVMSAQVAATLRRALAGVVATGTGTRARGVFVGSDGRPLAIGGKTGTGDNRFKSFGPGHQLIEARPVDRTATFVFFLGDRLYGTVTAYVSGPQADRYHFTSALAVSLLKALAPEFQPLLEAPASRPAAKPRLVVLNGN
jgi:membrane peptidoglycan carboxypeptidase